MNDSAAARCLLCCCRRVGMLLLPGHFVLYIPRLPFTPFLLRFRIRSNMRDSKGQHQPLHGVPRTWQFQADYRLARHAIDACCG